MKKPVPPTPAFILTLIICCYSIYAILEYTNLSGIPQLLALIGLPLVITAVAYEVYERISGPK